MGTSGRLPARQDATRPSSALHLARGQQGGFFGRNLGTNPGFSRDAGASGCATLVQAFAFWLKLYGHEVGRATAMRLRAAGVNARYLRGGIEGWRAAGQTLNPKGASS